MSNNILFVFEGEKTEKKITDNLTRYFLNENTIIQCAYCTDIYRLHKEILEDEDLDTFVLLRNIPQNTPTLSDFTREDFAEIYMFFDYDGHATLAEDEKVVEVLEIFCEETASGKLFISYPMVEALKHYRASTDFKNLKVKAKQNINYKNLVHHNSDPGLRDFNAYTKDIWATLIAQHLMKMNFIVNNDYSVPSDNSSQEVIFQNQLDKYINLDSTVGVLSAFPIFLFDYYGEKYIMEMIS